MNVHTVPGTSVLVTDSNVPRLRITNELDGSYVLLDCHGELVFAHAISFRMIIPEVSYMRERETKHRVRSE